MPDLLPSPPAALDTREAVLAKLVNHLNLAFGGEHGPRSSVPAHHSYLCTVVAVNFRLPAHAIKDAIAASATVADLAARTSDLLNIPNPELF